MSTTTLNPSDVHEALAGADRDARGRVPFPTRAMSEPARSLCTEGADAIGCPIEFIALPLLSALGAAIGNSRWVQVKPGHVEPPCLWTCIVADSGQSKSPALRLALQPYRAIQDEKFRRAEREHGDALQAWKDAGEEGDKPALKPERYIVSDSTTEAMFYQLHLAPRGLLLVRDELAGWLSSFDAYRKGRGGDAAAMLSAHGGESVTIDRRTADPPTIYIPRGLVSVTGGIQPARLADLLRGEHTESGLAARLLFAMPEPKAARYTEQVVDQAVLGSMSVVFDQLVALQPQTCIDGSTEPMLVPLTRVAFEAFCDYFNANGQAAMKAHGALKAAYPKLSGAAARLALVLHLTRWAADPRGDPAPIGVEAMENAVTLANWFAGEAERVYDLLAESQEDRDERALIAWIRARGGSCTASELDHGPRAWRGKGTSGAALDALVAAGLATVEVAQNPKGGPSTRRYVLK